MSEPALVDRFAELWEDVSRNAPEDVLPALQSAPPASADAAVAAIARGIVRSSEPDHPFPAALRTAAVERGPEAIRDPALEAYARALAPRLEEQLTAARAVLDAGAPRIGPAPSSGKPPSASAPDASRPAPIDADVRVVKGEG
jgi:hypothetical protein